MINVSNDFKERMKENRNFKNYAEITFADDSELTLDASQFSANNNSLVDGSASSAFPIGAAVQKNVQLEIINDEQQYADKDFLGAKIRLYTEFTLEDVDTQYGRNIVLKSNEQISNSNYLTNRYELTEDILDDEYYTTTIWGQLGEGKSFWSIGIGGGFNTFSNAYKIGEGVYRIISKINVSRPEHARNFINVYAAPNNGAISTINRIKIEKGRVDNPVWTPAPEDKRERIEKGTYTVVTPETYGETVIITAYDDMYKADKDYTTALTFPQTAGAVLRDICDTCDISLGSTEFLHDNFQIQNKPTGKFREVIGQIAMIACGNARIDRRNYLQIMPYNLEWGYNANVVAGENLLKNTHNPQNSNSTVATNAIEYDEIKKENVFVRKTTATSESFIYSSRSPQVEKSTDYTFSCDVFVNDYVRDIQFFWLSSISSETSAGTSWKNNLNTTFSTLERNRWNRLTWAFTTNADDYTGYIRIDNNGSTAEGTEAVLKVTLLRICYLMNLPPPKSNITILLSRDLRRWLRAKRPKMIRKSCKALIPIA